MHHMTELKWQNWYEFVTKINYHNLCYTYKKLWAFTFFFLQPVPLQHKWFTSSKIDSVRLIILVTQRESRSSPGLYCDRFCRWRCNIIATRVPIYWEFGQLAKILHFVSKLDTSLYSKSMGNSCQLSYCCVPFENEAIKPIKSIHIWKANTITIPNMDMSV